RMLQEFEARDFVVLNPHTLNLLRSEKGCSQKLLMHYNGPFKINHKLSLVIYQLHFPILYCMHPILDI
ncbi:hypothetical protein OE88DRAFT_1608176, partial [Heliocybe sulcata]